MFYFWKKSRLKNQFTEAYAISFIFLLGFSIIGNQTQGKRWSQEESKQII